MQPQETSLHFDLYAIFAKPKMNPIVDVMRKLQKTALNVFVSMYT